MDASQYKDYILTLLFMKYVSDKAKTNPNGAIAVPDGGAFKDLYEARGAKDIGYQFDTIIGRLAEQNDLVGVINQASFNDEAKLGKGKDMQDRLSELVGIFNDLDFGGSRAEGDDLLGDAYEYLMRHFATQSGKSKGQYYTPAEVSRVLAKVVGIGPKTTRMETVYDPTCGSGSLLIKAASEAPYGMSVYGQEKDNATWALARMNMFLHDNALATIEMGNTISDPKFLEGHQLKNFDFVVMNPPFSDKAWTTGLREDFGRFEYGMPPKKNGDYGYLLHALKSLNSTGKAAVILPHGVLFRGNAEAVIRTRLLQQGFIKGIIGLPANLFYGTSIPACVIVLDKEDAVARTGVFMIDASKGFMKDGNKNRLRSQDVHKIVDTFNKRVEILGYSRMVLLNEIAERNDYNLNIPRYIDSAEPEDIQDLHAHLHGGIPDRDIDALSGYWDAFPQLRRQLFQPNRPSYSDLSIDVGQVQQAILDAPEFQKLVDNARTITADWFAAHRGVLDSIREATKPADLIEAVSDDLLARFKLVPLLDEYDVYERLMTYWDESMHDDVLAIMGNGWLGAAEPRPPMTHANKKLAEIPDLVIGTGRNAKKYKMDVVPPVLIVGRYFIGEQAKVDALAAVAEGAEQAVREYIEENAVEEGLLAEAMNDKGEVTKTLVADRLKIARHEGADPDEIEALRQVIELYDAVAVANKAAKEAQAELNRRTFKKYADLTESDVKSLVLDSKWHATMTGRVIAEVEGLALALVSRIRQLGERYAETVDQLDSQLRFFEPKIIQHLASMGVT